jgi:mono/diheme cytochrome c family protein/peroxiredoxin
VRDVGTLRDLRGNARNLHSFRNEKGVVLAFLGTSCPVSNLYVPRLLDIERQYRGAGIQWIAVYPNWSEDLDQIAQHSSDRDVPFPVVKDVGAKLAQAVGVDRVPGIVLLDREWKIRYRGRIDDQYGVSYRKPKPARNDLREAIESLLAGREVATPDVETDGCLIEASERRYEKPGVTYARDVARIFQSRCQECHRPGQSAPFSLMTYDDAVRHARMIKEVVTQRRMPPWHADSRYGRFANDRRLSEAEIETLAAWVDAGKPKGDDVDLPPPRAFVSGWRHGQPDMIFTMPEEFEVPAEGSLPYQKWTIDPGFTEDKWVRIAECLPGAPAVVHHLVVYILPPGKKEPYSADGNISILAGWAPGDLGTVCPPDTALRLPKGCKLEFELHYTPNGTKVKDRSSVGIHFAKQPPKYEYFTNSFANESIVVPPHDPHFRAEQIWRLRGDARILSMVPHMHWRGKSYRYEVIYPDGRRETILNVPRWDFNWQNVYQLQEPLRLPKGAKLHAIAHWDNSANNPYNPDPTATVKFGLQTWEEMMVGWVAYVWERPETAEEVAKLKADDPDLLFDRFDRNGDDIITPAEVPAQLKPLMKLANLPDPDRLTRDQFKEMFESLKKRFGGARPPAKPGKDKQP